MKKENQIMETIDKIVDFIDAQLWASVPNIAKGFIIALVFVVLFRKKIKAHPVAFYIYPVIYVLWHIFYGIAQLATSDGNPPYNTPLYEMLGGDESWILNILHWLDHLGLTTDLGIGLLVIVMFIGVLPKTALVKNLFTIRTEMSIIGATILFGHGFGYLYSVFGDGGGGGAWLVNENEGYDFNFAFPLVYGFLGTAMVVLIFLPWITSFKFVRKKMKASTWKKLQTYTGVPFFVVMLLFGIGLNLITVGNYPNFATDMNEITRTSWDSEMSLGSGVDFAGHILAVKIYIFLLVTYIVLRIKKVRGKNRIEANRSAEESA
jgi:DMSO/TMAO reductase YedYZ heme-binding membrane subunit